jgi:HK97 family phage major capsid protein
MSDFEQKHMEALNALRAGVSKEMEEKINNLLDAQETKNQAKLKEIQEKANKAEELENRLNSIEADLKRGLSGEAKEAKTQELKSFEKLIKEGTLKMQHVEERKFLRENSNENGGYLAPSEYLNEIIKNITEVSPVRSVARVISTANKEVKLSKRIGLVTGGFIGEGQAASQSNSIYGEVTIPAHKLYTYTDISVELLRDSAYNMRTEISADISESFAQIEGQKFILGNGVSEPQGLLTHPNIGEVNSGSATIIVGDSLYEIQGEIKDGYNLAFMFNRRTLHKYIRTLKDGQGQYVLQQNFAATLPNTIAGLPYFIANDMPDVAAGTTPVIVGDYRKCYAIVDNSNIEFLEDPYTQAIVGKRRFLVYKRTGGGVILTEGLKKLKIAI